VPAGYGGYGGDLQHYPAHGGPSPAVPSYEPPAVPTYAPPRVPPAWEPAAPSPVGSYAPGFTQPQPQPPERPAVITMAATLAVTGSLQFLAALTLLWLLAVAGNDELGTFGADGVMFHVLNRFDDRMVDGLAWPLYGFPLAALVLGFLLPTRRPWTRIAFSVLGLLAVAWLAWIFRSRPVWLVVPVTYIGFTSGIVWTAAASRWYRWRLRSDADPQPR
jgi:hypothetical protein